MLYKFGMYGQTGKRRGVQMGEHKNNLKLDMMEKSKLAQHSYEEGHYRD
jgi:hypothetical protein